MELVGGELPHAAAAVLVDTAVDAATVDGLARARQVAEGDDARALAELSAAEVAGRFERHDDRLLAYRVMALAGTEPDAARALLRGRAAEGPSTWPHNRQLLALAAEHAGLESALKDEGARESAEVVWLRGMLARRRG